MTYSITPAKAAKYLKGKTIAEIKWHKYLSWDMCVEKIIFTDRTTVSLNGNADNGRFETIIYPNGRVKVIEQG